MMRVERFDKRPLSPPSPTPEIQGTYDNSLFYNLEPDRWKMSPIKGSPCEQINNACHVVLCFYNEQTQHFSVFFPDYFPLCCLLLLTIDDASHARFAKCIHTFPYMGEVGVKCIHHGKFCDNKLLICTFCSLFCFVSRICTCIFAQRVPNQ